MSSLARTMTVWLLLMVYAKNCAYLSSDMVLVFSDMNLVGLTKVPVCGVDCFWRNADNVSVDGIISSGAKCGLVDILSILRGLCGVSVVLSKVCTLEQ